MSDMKVERFTRKCESPACSHGRRLWRAWLEPLRGHSLDGHWYCSPECFEQALASAIGHLLPGKAQPPASLIGFPSGC